MTPLATRNERISQLAPRATSGGGLTRGTAMVRNGLAMETVLYRRACGARTACANVKAGARRREELRCGRAGCGLPPPRPHVTAAG